MKKEEKPKITNGMAIASLVLSIIGIIFGWLVLPILCSILGLIFGIIALNKIKKTGEGGKGLAIAGIIIGGVGLLILPIFAGISALAYFGVLSPGKWMPSTCIIESGFTCTDYKISETEIYFKGVNNLGYEAENVKVTLKHPNGWSDEANMGSVPNGESFTVSYLYNVKKGETYRGDIEISYQRSDSDFTQTVEGSIMGKPEP